MTKRITDKARIDWMQANDIMLDHSCGTSGVLVYLDTPKGTVRAKTIRQAVDVAIKSDRQKGRGK